MKAYIGGRWVDVVFRFVLNGIDGKYIVFTHSESEGEILGKKRIDSTDIRNPPIVRRYRTALMKPDALQSISTIYQAQYLESLESFVKWISDWVEYEV